MKIWKILVMVPYILIFGWIYISANVMISGNIGGLFVGGALWAVGIVVGFIYTIILGFALIIRWFIIRRKTTVSTSEAG